MIYSSLDSDWEPLEASFLGHILLKIDHSLLVDSGSGRLGFKVPRQERVGIVGNEVLIKHTQSLSVLGDFGLKGNMR